MQVLLRWLYEIEVSFNVQSYNKKRLEENFTLLDYIFLALNIKKLDSSVVQSSAWYIQPDCDLFRSFEDLWDK